MIGKIGTSYINLSIKMFAHIALQFCTSIRAHKYDETIWDFNYLMSPIWKLQLDSQGYMKAYDDLKSTYNTYENGFEFIFKTIPLRNTVDDKQKKDFDIC